MPHNNLTIDFNDASFDEANTDVQPIPGVSDIDVVFPISDDPNFTVARADNRTGSETSTGVGTGTASAIALMPDQATANVMDEFLFEFENDIDPQDAANNDQGLKITTEGGPPNAQVIKEINITGSFEDLHNGGTLDVHADLGVRGGNPFIREFNLGAPENDPGNQNAILVSGDNGADLGGGNDFVMINVDATADMTGRYQGGNGEDYLRLLEGVISDNGAQVDFVAGKFGDNSAFITNFGGVGSGLNFDVDGWETIQLTNNADFVVISDGVGKGLTNIYDASYLNGGSSNSMLQIKSGFTDGGMADVFKVDASSEIFLSFDFADSSLNGVNAVFLANGDVTVDDIGGSSANEIDVNIERTGGSGLTIDYFEGTSNADIVVNQGNNGITVNLGGADTAGIRDQFTGSTNSANDMLDAREAHTLTFTDGPAGKINVSGVSELGSAVHASLEDVDYIMVRDDALPGALPTGSTNEYIWSKVGTQDVDFYRDMSHLNNTYMINGLGTGATDAYGQGYDVMTSAIVDTFGTGSALRVYYEGEHDDFLDTNDGIIVNKSNGTVNMEAGLSSRGNTWEADIAGSGEYGKGQAPGFYIEIINAQDATDKDKLAVTFDDVKGMWKVDTTAVQVAEGATSAITAAATDVPFGNSTATSATSGAELAHVVADRFGIQLDMAQGVDHSSTAISGDIYLNATEEAITQLLGSGVEDKAYNFGFYTKVDLKAVGGDVTVNVNLQQQANGNTFKLDFKDLDVGVESFHNVVGVDATPAAGIISSSAAGEFVHIDNAQDIALGNGGNDTYVVGANASGTYGGTALEYGNIGTGGGLANSASDAVNFNSVNSVSDLIFERKAVRNEIDGNSLSIKDSVTGEETILFDNYNTYLDFRRVEYLTVEDGANNNEVYEIVTSANKNITDWDNEIYVAYGNTSTDVTVGGTDYVFGTSQADLVNLYLSGITGTSDEVATIDLSGLDSSDTVNVVAGGNISGTDATDAKTQLEAGINSGNDGKATITFDYDYNSTGTSKIIVEYDTVGTEDDFTAIYDYIG